jgi:hypothetical protein
MTISNLIFLKIGKLAVLILSGRYTVACGPGFTELEYKVLARPNGVECCMGTGLTRYNIDLS